MCIRPVMTYASPVFAHARPDILYDLQIVQNKFCRRAADAPWYVKNSVVHRDLELPTISKYMKDASERFFDVACSHPNPVIVSAVSYEPPPPSHFYRRPRNVLLDPPDNLTVEVINPVRSPRLPESPLKLQSVLLASRDLLCRGVCLYIQDTHRAVTRRRHHYVQMAAF
ncbi:Probable RNA-directed DNA polymerase from transposon X-element [Eumeta japonica]|uniref:Probable RNA-directed DNA polymerase from transposon X-element n=1 Tax=Eumeta variegata TaxID=151549 RepID=A0A4C1WDX4_EUMVA|nr:Probable RNA-directed DNA polymerase from transposon X-element [Eumeta japonica]